MLRVLRVFTVYYCLKSSQKNRKVPLLAFLLPKIRQFDDIFSELRTKMQNAAGEFRTPFPKKCAVKLEHAF